MSLTSWLYKQTHTITHGTGLTDYQVQFTVYKANGTSSGSSIYCNTHCNDDFSDIRFSVDDTTSLPYWIESYTSGVSAVIWVKIPTISTTTISVYYGNVAATSESNGDATFVFFDDFTGTTLDTTKWPSLLNSITYTVNNKLIITDASKSGDTYWIYNNTDTGSQLVSNATIPTNCEVIIKQTAYDTSSNQMGQLGPAFTSSNNIQACTHHGDGNGASIQLYHNSVVGSTAGTPVTVSSPNARFFSLIKLGTTYTSRHAPLSDGPWSSHQTVTNTTSVSKLAIAVGAYGGYVFLNKVEVEYIFLKNAVSVEPTQGTWSSEQYIGGTGVFISAVPSSGTPPLTTSIYVSTSDPLTNFELLYGDGESYDIPKINYNVFITTLTSNGALFQGHTFRNVISSANILESATNIRVKIVFPSSGTLILTHVSIVERDGSTANGTTIPTELTFNNGSSGVTVTTTDVYSDWIAYTIDPTKDYLVILDISATSTGTARLYTGSSYYKNATSSWNTPTLTSPSTYTYGNNAFAIESYTSNITGSFATTHIYDTFGTYQVYTSGYIGTAFYEDYANVIVSNNSLTASFTKVQTLNNVVFTDTSTGSPNEWFWDFGDNSTSQLKNPTHTYQAPGTYTVTLYASNQQFNGLATSSVTIANPTPTVGYIYVISINSVHFNTTTTINQSLNERIVSYYWDFKDGYTSTLQNPIHAYATVGTYAVSVVVTNNYGVTATYSQSIVITDSDPYTVKFSPCYEIGGLGHTVNFYDLTMPQIGILTRTWNFGDGGTSTDQNPTHTYTTAGIYSPSLTVTYTGGSTTLTKNNTILINQRTKLLIDELSFSEGFNKFNIMIFIESLACGDLCVRALMLVERLAFTNDDLPEYGLTEFGHTFKGTLTGYGESIYGMLTGFGRMVIVKTPLVNLDCFKTLTFMKFKERIAFKQKFEKNKL